MPGHAARKFHLGLPPRLPIRVLEISCRAYFAFNAAEDPFFVSCLRATTVYTANICAGDVRGATMPPPPRSEYGKTVTRANVYGIFATQAYSTAAGTEA